MSANITIAEVMTRFKSKALTLFKFTPEQHKALRLIEMCRTGKLGSHIEKCNACGHKKVHYNSCGNRNCPNCQAINKEKWVLDRSFDLLPVKYFHAVFTIPSQLRILFIYNKKLLYNLLFRCVKETLFEFALDPRQKMEAKLGLVSILHTWNQKMQFHPHIHCIIPAGGINKRGEWKASKGKKNYLFSASALSSKFKQKFLINLVKIYKNGELKIPPNDVLWNTTNSFYKTKSKLYKTAWVVYAKEAFGGPQQVLEYLGRYTHRIAISNHRIICMTNTHVTFRYLDRKTNTTQFRKVKGEEFVKLFLQHVLPFRFTKIRHYGFLSSRSKNVDLAKIRKVLNAQNPGKKVKLSAREVIILTKGVDPYICSKCKKGMLVVVEIIPGIRGSPPRGFAKDKVVKLDKVCSIF